MNKFLTRKFFILALFLSSVWAPAAYSQQQGALLTAPPVVSQSSGEHEKRIATEPFLRTELFFGTKKPNGEVTEEEFEWFLDEIVTPEFPDGLTLLSGTGQFRGSDNITIQERSKVLILLYPVKTQKKSSEKIEKIRDAYKWYFQQESVLRVDDRRPAQVSF